MTETKQTEVPKFRVKQAPGFATGLGMYPPDSEIDWVVPDGWDAEKNGKHFASHGPSTSFEPMNEAAVTLLEAHKRRVLVAHKPPTDESAALRKQVEKLQELVMQLLADKAGSKK